MSNSRRNPKNHRENQTHLRNNSNLDNFKSLRFLIFVTFYETFVKLIGKNPSFGSNLKDKKAILSKLGQKGLISREACSLIRDNKC